MAYRFSQGFAALIVGLSFLLTPLPPDTPLLFPFALTLAAIFLLASMVRIVGGRNAGAVSLVVLPFYPGYTSSSNGALAFFCLSASIALLGTREYTADRKHTLTLCLALAAAIALGFHNRICLLPLSAAISFAYLLLRYVPPDSTRPYRTLWNSLRANRPPLKWEVLIITVAGLLSLLPLFLSRNTRIPPPVNFAIRNPIGYLRAVADLLSQFLGIGEDLDTLPALLTPPLLLASFVTLWWLFVSIQSANGLPFCLTAIPVSYLFSGGLNLRVGTLYAHRVHPILLANLIAFVGLWLRGRANKRVLDSTRD